MTLPMTLWQRVEPDVLASTMRSQGNAPLILRSIRICNVMTSDSTKNILSLFCFAIVHLVSM